MERASRGVLSAQPLISGDTGHRDSSVITIPAALHADEPDNQRFLTLETQAAFTFPRLFLSNLLNAAESMNTLSFWQNGEK